jgi:hypothetical protein
VKAVTLLLLNGFSAFTESSFDTTAAEQSARKRLSMHVSIRGGEVGRCVDRGGSGQHYGARQSGAVVVKIIIYCLLVPMPLKAIMQKGIRALFLLSSAARRSGINTTQ